MNSTKNVNSVNKKEKTIPFILRLLYKCFFIFVLITSVFFAIHNIRETILYIMEDQKAVIEMDKVNDFMLSKYNFRLKEIRKYKYFIIPIPIDYNDSTIGGPAVELENGRKINPKYVLEEDDFPDKFKHTSTYYLGSYYYLPFRDRRKAEKKYDSLLKEDGMGYNIVNSGIFYYRLSDSDFPPKKHLMVLDAHKYFSNEHRKDEYFDSIEEALENSDDFKYAPDKLKHINIILKKDEYEGGCRICYMSEPKGIEGYLVEADIKVNDDGMFCVKSAKVFKYEKDWVNNARYSFDKSEAEDKSGGFTGDDRLNEVLKEYDPEAALRITEIPMDDRIIYFWQMYYPNRRYGI